MESLHMPAPDPKTLKWEPRATLQTGEPWSVTPLEFPTSWPAPGRGQVQMARPVMESSLAEAIHFKEWMMKGPLGGLSAETIPKMREDVPFLACRASIQALRPEDTPVGAHRFDFRLKEKIFISRQMRVEHAAARAWGVVW